MGYLEKLVDGLKSLDKKQFKYDEYVAEFRGGCGTICCAYGWMPKFVPEAKIAWIVVHGQPSVSINAETVFTVIHNHINIGKNVPSLVNFMFFGSIFDEKHTKHCRSILVNEYLSTAKNDTKNLSFDDIFGIGYYADLEQVINRIEVSINIAKNVIENGRYRDKKLSSKISAFIENILTKKD